MVQKLVFSHIGRSEVAGLHQHLRGEMHASDTLSSARSPLRCHIATPVLKTLIWQCTVAESEPRPRIGDESGKPAELEEGEPRTLQSNTAIHCVNIFGLSWLLRPCYM